MRNGYAIALFILLPLIAFPQKNARNGKGYPPTGDLRLFIVFADVVTDSCTDTADNWEYGQLPTYADSLVDENYTGGLISYMSRYYREASFGTIRITGDYFP